VYSLIDPFGSTLLRAQSEPGLLRVVERVEGGFSRLEDCIVLEDFGTYKRSFPAVQFLEEARAGGLH
jgi:hypothetical protein